jgi:glycosyltransferase involved in cell wall biosynthesis
VTTSEPTRPASPVRTLQVLDTLGMGGAETWLMEVLRSWAKTKVARMDFLITSGNRGTFDDEAMQLGAQIHYARYGRSDLFPFTREFRKLLKSTHYDAIHDHQDYASGWHYLIGRNVLPRFRVTHVHNPSYQILNNYGVTFGRRLTALVGKRLVSRYASHIAGTSWQVITEYGFDTPRFQHIPKAALHCGFDPKRFNGNKAIARCSVCREFGWPDAARIVLFVGRIDQSPNLGDPQNHKNSGFAVSVGIECVRRDPSVRMLFAGAPSPAVPILQQRIAAAGAMDRIQFVGVRKDIERLMLGCDALLFPSRGEGLGMVAVEAQAAGVPVLASTAVPRECVVVPELVRFEELKAGKLVWADRLLELTVQPRDVGTANRRVAASSFAIDKSAQALLMLYTNGLFV